MWTREQEEELAELYRQYQEEDGNYILTLYEDLISYVYVCMSICIVILPYHIYIYVCVCVCVCENPCKF